MLQSVSPRNDLSPEPAPDQPSAPPVGKGTLAPFTVVAFRIIWIANLFANSTETNLVFLGGYVFPKTGVVLGPFTTRILEEVHVHQTILSVGGITPKGLFNSNLLLVETERQMMRCADRVMVIADHTKVGRQNLAFLCELSAIDTLIVDPGLEPEHRNWLAESGVHVVIAGKASQNAYPRKPR